ncbi:MAG: ATP-dependent zinc protease [Gammaproteobacteria bacterium HGW-Gammaproteobacteria-7]|nr:MAG: ATP-dependent zinc protease [Gammaproteobacteria bacterium HGW-Gammaproteobacteria-7]
MANPSVSGVRGDQPIVLGWREWLSLPELGIAAIRAKVDTGARSSALHVESMEEFDRDGVPWVRFSVALDHHGERPVSAVAPVVDRRMVTDSGGHRTQRVFIRTLLSLAGVRREIEINLTDRRNMLFPMLLGRTALSGCFAVDPAHSFIHGEPAPPAGASR